MNQESRRWLLRRARSAIASRLEGGRSVREIPPPTEVRRARCGVFVSLHHRETDKLRGCVGYLGRRRSLPHDITAAAEQAAFADHRFDPVATPQELANLELEVSLLSRFEVITAEDDIMLETHGACVEIAGRTGLLLPQVAEGRDWDVETFLRHVCAKAGRLDSCWRQPGAVLYRFTAEVFDDRAER